MASLMYNNSTVSYAPTNNYEYEMKRFTANVNYILKFVQTFIVLFGVLGNTLALLVINKKSLSHTSSATYITYLALFDSFALLMHTAKLLITSRNPYICCSLAYFTDLSIFCASWILVIITLERCIAVYSPLLAKRLCTVNSARRSIYIFLAVSIVTFSVKFPFLYGIESVSGTKICLIKKHAVLILRIYQPILFYAIPDLLLLSNLFTVYSLRKRSQALITGPTDGEQKLEMRINDINSNRKQRQLTIMLVTVSLAFYLFTTPAQIAFIMQIYTIQHRDIRKSKQKFLLQQISVIMLQLNNATNFIFYCFTGQRFRQETMHTFYDYMAHIKNFYHRRILGNKEYNFVPIYQYNLGRFGNTTVTCRSSYSPYSTRSPYRASAV